MGKSTKPLTNKKSNNKTPKATLNRSRGGKKSDAPRNLRRLPLNEDDDTVSVEAVVCSEEDEILILYMMLLLQKC